MSTQPEYNEKIEKDLSKIIKDINEIEWDLALKISKQIFPKNIPLNNKQMILFEIRKAFKHLKIAVSAVSAIKLMANKKVIDKDN